MADFTTISLDSTLPRLIATAITAIWAISQLINLKNKPREKKISSSEKKVITVVLALLFLLAITAFYFFSFVPDGDAQFGKLVDVLVWIWFLASLVLLASWVRKGSGGGGFWRNDPLRKK